MIKENAKNRLTYSRLTSKSIPSWLILVLYLVIVLTVFGKKRGVSHGLALTNTVSTVTSPLTLSSKEGRCEGPSPHYLAQRRLRQ